MTTVLITWPLAIAAASIGVMCLALWRGHGHRRAQALLLVRIGKAAERQKMILDSAVDTILTLDPSGCIESVNAAGLRLLGYEEQALLRRDISFLIDMTPERYREFLQRISSEENLENGVTRELVAKHKSGRDIPVDVTIRAMALSDGVHVVAVVRDSSERRRMDATKDSFIATVSHELRTPLTSIAGSLGLLKGGAGGQLPKGAFRLVEIAEGNSARLVRLINDILDMEKMRAGVVVLDRKPVQLKVLMEAGRDAMSGFAFGRGVTINLTPVDETLWILADYDRMMQVMTNLLSNAIKVSAVGENVRLSAEVSGRLARISVIDHGPGVANVLHDKIFERFVQADDSDGRPIEGTGLGLPIVREIVERHGGQVDFHNNAGAGATFFIDLALIECPRDVEPQLTDDALKILICEDDELIAEVLSEQLTMLGYKAEVVWTANAARHALHMGSYKALLLDIRLPDSDGITLMRALRSAPATACLPIIIMSGSVEHQDQAEGLGIIDWLTKPISMDHLEAAWERALVPDRKTPALILHIDDDEDLVEVARSHLGGLGEVLTAQSLTAARTMITKRRPDLIILDLGLPDGSGEDFVVELRTMDRPIPTIIYSAQDIAGLAVWPVAAALVKSRTDLPKLARAAKRVLEEGVVGTA